MSNAKSEFSHPITGRHIVTDSEVNDVIDAANAAPANGLHLSWYRLPNGIVRIQANYTGDVEHSARISAFATEAIALHAQQLVEQDIL